MKDSDKIEDYLRGFLSPDEVIKIELLIQTDEEFKNKYHFEKQLFDTLNQESWSHSSPENKEVINYKKLLKDKDVQDLKKTLHSLNRNNKNTGKRNFSFTKVFFYSAASVIVLFFVFQFFISQNPSNTELYYTYANLDNLPSFVTRSANVSSEKLIEGQQLFENKDYRASIDQFYSALDTEAKDARVYLYLGLGLSEIESYDKAEKTFDQLIASDLLDKEKGYWYKALLYLKMGNLEKAKDALLYIVDNKLYNHKEAEELLKQIK